jgi:hypothetical protein
MDLQQSYAQILAEFPGVDYLEWVQSVFHEIFPEVPANVLAQIIGRMGQVMNWRRPDPFYDSDLTSMASEVLAMGFATSYNRLLIVGHSQGSIYANIMYRKLQTVGFNMRPEQIGLMSVAAFVPSIAGANSQYVTNKNDRPVNTGRTIYPDVLGYSVTLAHTEAETNPWRGHGFQTIYLAQSAGRTQIVSKMKTVLNTLKSSATPPPQWLRSTGSMYYCGPLQAWYGPPPWKCYIDGGSYTVNMMKASVAGSDIGILQPGTLAQAETATKAHEAGCFNLFIADRKTKLTTGNYAATNIKGCGPGYNYPYSPYSSSEVAWKIYSADTVQMKTSYVLQPPVLYGPTGQDVVYVERFPVCRRI